MNSLLLAAMSAATIGMVSVGSILIVLFLLSCENGLNKALGYVVGYILTYLAIGGAIITIGPAEEGVSTGHAATLVGLAKILLGVLFLVMLAKGLLRRGDARRSPSLKFLTGNHVNFAGTFKIGIIAPVINIKNLAIFAYAMSFLAVMQMNFLQATASVLAVTLVFCSTVILPVVAYAAAPQHSAPLFGEIRIWLENRSTIISNVVFSVVGTLFLVQGFTDLRS